MGEENKYIHFDWAIKYLLRDKANFDILEGLLSVLIGESIKIDKILESESNQENAYDKFNRVDIKAENDKGEIIIVEVQVTRQLHYLKRILYGTSKTITEHIKVGESYENIKKVYSISLLYCDFGEGGDYLYHGKTHFLGLHTGDELVVSMKEKDSILKATASDVFPEYYIVRLNQFDRIPENPLEEWMDYLRNGKIKDNTDVPGLQAVKRKFRYMLMSDEEKRAYMRHMDAVMTQNDVFAAAKTEGRAEGWVEGRAEGIAEGRAEGRAEGIAEGRAEEKAVIAKSLKDAGLTAEFISQHLELPLDYVKSL